MGKQHRIEKAQLKAQHEELAKVEQLRIQSQPLAKILALVLALITFVIYTLTLFPTVPGGDSGELIAAAYTTGIAHPPGYPLFTLLAKLFTLLPFHNPAWRVNLLSAASTSAASAILVLIVSSWTAMPWAGFLSGGLFAFSPLIWTYAVQAEVFGLNLFFAGLLLLFALRYLQQRKLNDLRWGAFLFGLGLTHHHTLLFVGAPVALTLLWQTRLGQTRRELTLKLAFTLFWQLTLLFLLGLTPYLYLPWAASHYPFIAWGDQTTWDGFWTHVLRKEYGTLQLAPSTAGPDLIQGLFLYLTQLPKETFYIGLPLAALGIYLCLRREKNSFGFGKLTFLCFILYLVIFHLLANLPLSDPLYFGVHQRFWMLSNFFIFLWIGPGFATLINNFIKQTISPRITPPAETGLPQDKKSSSKFEYPKKGRIAFFGEGAGPWMAPQILKNFFCPGVAIFIILLAIAFNYSTQDQHLNHLYANFGKSILQELPPSAILLSRGDVYTNTTRYLQQCENFRTDVKIIDRILISYPWMKQQILRHFPEVNFPGDYYRFMARLPGEFALVDILNANEKQFPLFICNLDPNEARVEDWKKLYSSWPYGLVNWFVPNGRSTFLSFDRAFDLEKYIHDTDRVIASLNFDELPKGNLISWENYIWNEYWEADHRRARRLLTLGIETHNPQALRKAAAIMQNVLDHHPSPSATLYKNLGYAYSQLSQYDPSVLPAMVKVWGKYLELGPASDPDIPKIRGAISAASH